MAGVTDRAPLDEGLLRRALRGGGGGLWRDLTLVAETGSTNADLAAAARDGAPEGRVLVAEWQSAGRGRLGRSWSAPPRSALTFSVLLRPDRAAPALWAWVPLLVGVGAADAVRRATGVGAVLKWPNDVLVEDRKLAGILAERERDAVVVGLGLNVGVAPEELPSDTDATSLAVEGSTVDRDSLLLALLHAIERHYLAWRAAGGDVRESGVYERYRGLCATVGRHVRVELPGGGTLRGTAEDVDVQGRLVVRRPDGTHAVSAGDVLHVR